MTIYDAGKTADDQMARRSRRAYILALSIIALTTVAAFGVENWMMQKFERSAIMLNKASEQRALSNKIALFASDVLTAPDYSIRAMAANNVDQTKQRMNVIHDWLVDALEPETGVRHLSQELRDIFFDTPYALDAKMVRYNKKIAALLDADADQLQRSYNAVYFEAVGPLATSLDAAVAQLEEDAHSDVQMMHQLRIALMIVVIVMLAAEWLFIFRPLARAVEQKTQELEKAHHSVARAALHDPLTDLPNRRLLDQILATTQAQAQRSKQPLTVCHVDLDWFKQINDTLGHSMGDKVISHAANVLRNATRQSDFIARVGGDEFVIVDCTFGGEDGVTIMADRIAERMARPFEIDGHVCRIGASIGIASCVGDDRDIEALMCRSDIALYYAKELGRGQVQVYSEAAQVSFDNRRSRVAA